MSSPKKCALPRQLGVLSRLPVHRAEEIRRAARAARVAYMASDVAAWETLIDHANRELTKYERGFFSGVLFSEVAK